MRRPVSSILGLVLSLVGVVVLLPAPPMLGRSLAISFASVDAVPAEVVLRFVAGAVLLATGAALIAYAGGAVAGLLFLLLAAALTAWPLLSLGGLAPGIMGPQLEVLGPDGNIGLSMLTFTGIFLSLGAVLAGLGLGSRGIRAQPPLAGGSQGQPSPPATFTGQPSFPGAPQAPGRPSGAPAAIIGGIALLIGLLVLSWGSGRLAEEVMIYAQPRPTGILVVLLAAVLLAAGTYAVRGSTVHLWLVGALLTLGTLVCMLSWQEIFQLASTSSLVPQETQLFLSQAVIVGLPLLPGVALLGGALGATIRRRNPPGRATGPQGALPAAVMQPGAYQAGPPQPAPYQPGPYQAGPHQAGPHQAGPGHPGHQQPGPGTGGPTPPPPGSSQPGPGGPSPYGPPTSGPQASPGPYGPPSS